MAQRNIILVGFMGAGKSACGRVLARRLGRCFVETDHMITSREGCSIPEIFARDGEARFRELEGEVLESLALKSGDIVATGGGLPCRDGRMDRLRELGTVVWLAGDVRDLVARARRSGGRPMLEGRPQAAIEALYQQREPYYQQADIVVDTTGLGPDQVAMEVIRALRTVHGARA